MPRIPDLQIAPAPRGTDPGLVLVEWLDAWFDLEEDPEEPPRDDYVVRTVGFLVRSGAVVSVAQERLPDGEGFRAITHIPGGMVRSIVPLSVPDAREALEA